MVSAAVGRIIAVLGLTLCRQIGAGSGGSFSCLVNDLAMPKACHEAVSASSSIRLRIASSLVRPQISTDGSNARQTSGRSGLPYNRQRLSLVSWMQRTPAGLGPDMPGIVVLMLMAMQHAPHPTRHWFPKPTSHFDGDSCWVMELTAPLPFEGVAIGSRKSGTYPACRQPLCRVGALEIPPGANSGSSDVELPDIVGRCATYRWRQPSITSWTLTIQPLVASQYRKSAPCRVIPCGCGMSSGMLMVRPGSPVSGSVSTMVRSLV